MNGAIAEPSVRITNPPNTTTTNKIGYSQNFLRCLRKCQNSLAKLMLPPCSWGVFLRYCRPLAAARSPRSDVPLQELDLPLLPGSIGFETILVFAAQGRILILFAQHAVAGDQHFDVGTHEAAEGIFRRAHDRFAADVEARIDQYRTAGADIETREKFVIARVGLLVDGLDARR